jgi:2'-5' RNA ligase
MERLFLAILLPDEIVSEIRSVERQLQGQMRRSKVAWVAPEQAHITLHFLGDTDEMRRDELIAMLHEVEYPQPFELTLTGVAAFPNKKQPKVIHVAFKNHPNATGLYARTARVLVELGFELDERPWTPHITIGRVKVQSEVLKPEEIVVRQLEFTVSSFALMRSILMPQGSLYEAIETFQI